MRLLILDPLANALDFAMRAQKDGHSVKHFIRQTEKTKNVARGLTEVVEDFKPWWRWADLVFNADNSLYLRDITGLLGHHPIPYVGALDESAAWEMDRTVGQQVFKKHGIAVIPSKEFNDYDTAIHHVKNHDVRFVSKPSGDADKALSYVSKSPADMIYMLERWKKLGKLKSPFLLQEFVPGVEMAVGGWFGLGGFNEGWCENFEFKKLMNNDLGVATGEQGTVLRYTRTSKLARRVLAPLSGALERVGYCGYVDVNTIIDDKGIPWPLEFTMRPGWPTFNIQQCLHEGDSVAWIMSLASGKDLRNVVQEKVAVGVVMSIPDYPYSHLTRKEVVGIPVYGLTQALWKHWHPCEMRMGEDIPDLVDGHHIKVPMPVTAGDYVGVMTATSDTIKDAALTCYRRLEKLIVPNSPMYRTDIGKKLAKELPKIQKFGYAEGMVYSPTS
jgi:phosphoribosylamine--glycine ligase